MDLILRSLVPIAFVVLLGWIMGRSKIIEAKFSSQFASYVLNISFPCLLLLKTTSSKVEDLINYRFIGGFALGLMGMYALVLMINRYIYKRPLNVSCQSAFMSAFPNMAFMGIPVFTVIFGEESLVTIVIGNIITSLFMIPITVSILEVASDKTKKVSILKMMSKVFTKPLVLAPIIGFMISTLGFKLPILANESLKLVGSTTSGVSLFTLGLLISAESIHVNRYVISNICCKNFLHPLIMYGITLLVGISGIWAKEAILLCAMPSAITATLFAVKYDTIKTESSSTAVLSTIISLFSLAFIMYVLGVGSHWAG